jgi:hypothetical protein
MLEASNHEMTAAAPPRRRITADSFRALTARLAGTAFVPREEPVAAEVAPIVTAAPIVFDAPPSPPPVFEPTVDWAPPPVAPQFEEPVYASPPHEEPSAPPEAAFDAAPSFAPTITEPEPEVVAVVAPPVPLAEETYENFSPPPVVEQAPAPEFTDTLEWAKRAFAEIAQEAEAVSPPPEPVMVIEETTPELLVEPAVEEPAPQPFAPEPEPEPLLVEPTPQPKPRESSILRRSQQSEDPFAGAIDFTSAAAVEQVPVIVEDPDTQAGEVARSLIDIMAASAGTSQPQERALAADTLLRLVPRVPAKELVQIADRVAKMDNPPQLLVQRIIRDPRPEVAATLLERASNIPDQELLAVAAENDALKLRMIARRRSVSTALSDAIVRSGDASALLTLVRNPGASISHDAFQTLAEMARHTQALHAPLATRADIPPVVAFQMFWLLPAELRRYILSRFLTDSETLNRILKITMAVDGGEAASEASEAKFPDAHEVDRFIDLAAIGDIDGAVWHLSEIGGICEETGRRILADAEGEPLAVLLKSLGLSRTRFGEAVERLSQPPAALLRPGRNLADLQSIFDQLSFNKARVLLTYWDWAAQQTGPYAKRAA